MTKPKTFQSIDVLLQEARDYTRYMRGFDRSQALKDWRELHNRFHSYLSVLEFAGKDSTFKYDPEERVRELVEIGQGAQRRTSDKLTGDLVYSVFKDPNANWQAVDEIMKLPPEEAKARLPENKRRRLAMLKEAKALFEAKMPEPVGRLNRTSREMLALVRMRHLESALLADLRKVFDEHFVPGPDLNILKGTEEAIELLGRQAFLRAIQFCSAALVNFSELQAMCAHYRLKGVPNSSNAHRFIAKLILLEIPAGGSIRPDYVPRCDGRLLERLEDVLRCFCPSKTKRPDIGQLRHFLRYRDVRGVRLLFANRPRIRKWETDPKTV